MLARVAMPAVRQKRSKLAPTSRQASSTIATGTTAADLVDSFMALLLLGDPCITLRSVILLKKRAEGGTDAA
jgi:hypothetical protein